MTVTVKKMAIFLAAAFALFPFAAGAQAVGGDAGSEKLPEQHPMIAKCQERAKTDRYLLQCLEAGLRTLEIQWQTLEQSSFTSQTDRIAFEDKRDETCAQEAADFVLKHNKMIPAIPETECKITRTQARIDVLSD